MTPHSKKSSHLPILLASLGLALALSSCSVVSAPFKVIGAAATTVKTTGKIIGAGVDAVSGDDESE